MGGGSLKYKIERLKENEFKEIGKFLLFSTGKHVYFFSSDERAVYRIRNENELIFYISQNKRREPPPFNIPSIGLLEEMYETRMKDLVLNITENCNLRCKYCIFGKSYPSVKGYSKRFMKREIALRAIKYFLERVKNNIPTISFYGGEPMLRFNDIIAIIDTVKNKIYKKKLFFIIDTNATLLNEEKIKKLVKRGVGIQISLDGPSQVHDFNRVNKNNKGTFQKVYGLIKYIYKEFPIYYKEKVYFQITLTPLIDLKEVYKFFTSELFTNNVIHITFLDMQEYNTYMKKYGSESRENIFKKSIKELKDQFMNKLSKGIKPDNFLWQLFGQRLMDIHLLLGRQSKSNAIPLNGNCLPGLRKLYVDVEGKFYPCEKVLEKLCIGSLKEGINIKKIYDILKEYEAGSLNCKFCFARELCKICFSSVVNRNGKIDGNRKQNFCKEEKRIIARAFIEYAKIMERNLHALDFLKNYVIW